MVQCNCDYCENIKVEVFTNFRCLINKFNKKLILKVIKGYYILFKRDSKVIESTKLIDYISFAGELNSDEREIVRINPKNGTELKNYIHKISEKEKHIRQTDYPSTIINKLLNHKVIYRIANKIKKRDIEIAKDLILKSIGEVKYDYESPNESGWESVRSYEIIEELLNILLNGSYKEFFQCFTENDDYIFTIKKNNFMSHTNVRYKFENRNYRIFVNKYPIFYKYILNDFFFKKTTSIIKNNNIKFVKPLFYSEPEKSLFVSLNNTYSSLGCIVIPNKKLSETIDIWKLRDHFIEKEFSYLCGCVFDFIIYSPKGIPFKVNELQAGKHHNDKEWIIKDNLKKRLVNSVVLCMKNIFDLFPII